MHLRGEGHEHLADRQNPPKATGFRPRLHVLDDASIPKSRAQLRMDHWSCAAWRVGPDRDIRLSTEDFCGSRPGQALSFAGQQRLPPSSCGAETVLCLRWGQVADEDGQMEIRHARAWPICEPAGVHGVLVAVLGFGGRRTQEAEHR